MKKYFTILFVLFFTTTLSSNELSWVDTQVEAIKPPRKGMSNSNIANIRSPFIFLNKSTTKSKKRYSKSKKKSSSYLSSKKITSFSDNSDSVASKNFKLSAVINNSALINDKWYKLNDSINSYKLSSINRTTVVLTKGKKKLVLSTSDVKRNLKFK